ncbi:MAG: ImmA/IrrE family metallo-endopeptidase [Ignavibacteria bacterium]
MKKKVDKILNMKTTKRNTVEIGNKFEKRVYDVFANELRNKRLYIDPKTSKIKAKQGYHSKDRGENIIVDISIESYLPQQTDWSQLIIIECKDYNSSVPVNDIEEFYSKLMQIAGSGIKGIVVSSQGFQKSSLAYAKSKNIGLIKLNNNENFSWILTRIAPIKMKQEDFDQTSKEIQLALTSNYEIEDNVELYANINDYFTTSIETFFRFFLSEGDVKCSFEDNSKSDSVVQFMTKGSIEKLANEVNQNIEFDKFEHSITDNCKRLEKKYKIRFEINQNIQLDHLGFVILGKIKFNPDIITLYLGAQSNKFRLKFTLAHELGHYFLNHKKYLIGEIYSEQEYKNKSGEHISIDDIRKIEWQANQFASCFLLPHDPFIEMLNNLLKQDNINDKGHGRLFVDNQKCNLDSYYKVINLLRNDFRVSGSVIEYRLKNLGLLIDRRSKQKAVSI